MDNIELILRLLKVKADHYWGSAFTYGQTHFKDRFKGTPSAVAREELYDAKCDAIRDFIDEIRGSIAQTATQTLPPAGDGRDERYAFITEMAGTMTATIKNTHAELEDARDRFARDHEDYFEENANAKSAWNPVEITPRETIPLQDALSTGLLDVRFALITEVNGDLRALICDTKTELLEEVASFERDHEHDIASQDAVWSSHEIVVPARPTPTEESS